MQKEAVILRVMEPADIAGAMELSVAAGWNQTTDDWRFLIEDEQNICIAAVDNNKVIGTTVVLDYEGKLGWVGMVLVHTDHRGKGISRRLLQYVTEQYNPALKLDATALGEPVYRKFGFENEYSITRMVNNCVGDMALPHNDCIPAAPRHFPGIVELDAEVFGTGRKKLIAYLMERYPGKAIVQEENNRVEGFTLGRNGHRYHHIGPVVAATDAKATLLVKQALQKLQGQPVVTDVLSDKQNTIEMLRELGFSEQRRFVRMYRNGNLFAGNTAQLYAIAGPEFG
ncbi:MAG: GNAT family N-acetyltransferase [Chitinophagaceae bacterium]|nr:GNAT family N-acetyltransferase [Chitinophagaceae bacterium]MCW5925416.1 GNAT family N-acetyltransferase [Chitinophagaceae bacterium]